MNDEEVREVIAQELHKRGINGGSYKELQADFYWIRNRRYGEQRLKDWITRAIIGVLVTAALAALGTGILSHFGGV